MASAQSDNLSRESSWSFTLNGGRTLEIPKLNPRPLVMGILNVTPDSFSDGGLFLESKQAIDHGLRMLDEGADLLDIGAESSRPGGGVYGSGAAAVDADQELDRLLPVLDGLRKATSKPLSVDTAKAKVAAVALRHGADIINDIGGLGDPEMRAVLTDAKTSCPIVVMHSRGARATMQRGISFDDVTAEVSAELGERIERAETDQISSRRLIIDPGIGFGKKLEHNLELLAQIDRLSELGYPILVGASRKSFIDGVSPSRPDQRLGGSLAAVAHACESLRVAIVRVHDIAQSVQFVRVWSAIDSKRASEAHARDQQLTS